jgi:hypothetical protein
LQSWSWRFTYIPRDMTGQKFAQWLCQLGQGLWTAHRQYPAGNREYLRPDQGNGPFATWNGQLVEQWALGVGVASNSRWESSGLDTGLSVGAKRHGGRIFLLYMQHSGSFARVAIQHLMRFEALKVCAEAQRNWIFRGT